MASRHRLIISILVCCCLLFSAGCTPLTTLIHQQPTVDATKYIKEYGNHWRYSALDASLQSCYGTIYTVLTDGFSDNNTVTLAKGQADAVTTHGVSIALPKKLTSQDEAQTIFNAILYDNPQFFYLNNHYGLEGYEKNGQAYYTSMLFTYTMDAASRQAAKQQLDTAVAQIVAQAPDTTDEYLIETHLHDHLVANCTYDTEAAAADFDTHPLAYSAYGALVDGKAVCEGYARAMQLLLTRCGIASTPMLGESIQTGEQHMWNIVTINGENYHLDATWNDSEDTLRHNYFNVTTEQIQLSHRIHTEISPNVPCTAITDNYYHRNGLYIRSYSRQAIATVIANRIKAGDTQIELQFDADKFDNALLFLKNFTAASEQINPLLAGSGYTLWSYRLFGETDEHILCIRKK